MPQLTPFDLVGGFYRDDSLPADAQDCVNWIPEASEVPGGRTPTKLRDAPGLRPKIRVGTGPIRGMRNVEGKLMVVSGNTLYQVTPAGVAIPRGTIPGITTVSITHNQRGTANQVLIVNGSAGYVYDTAALTLERITDPGYPGAFIADFVDGYLPQIEPQRRFWFHSELRQAKEYNTLDRYPAEGQPDALVTLIVDHREVWVFGERSTEVYVNAGTLTNTFQRASNTVIEQGCSARFSPAKIDNSMMWLDDFGIIRRAQGYTPVRVSTGAIERDIRDLDWSRAFGYTMTEQGHAIYYLTFPDGKTWGYDIVTGLFHRRASYGLNRWRPSCMAYWNGEYVAGDYQQGLIYAVDWEYPFDGVLPHVRERATGVTHSNQNRVVIPYAEIIAQTGEKIVEVVQAPAQPDPPTITVAAPDGIVGDAYTHTYTLADGTPPYVVSRRSGTLPPGLALSSSGVLSGTPTTSGTYTFTPRVTDTNGLYDDLNESVNIFSADPVLVTNGSYYIGDRDALTLEASIGWADSPVSVSSSPDGIYATASKGNTSTGTYFQIRKFDVGSSSWSAVADPADMPVIGPNQMSWNFDGSALLLVQTKNANDNFMVYTRSGDTFTKAADPVFMNAGALTGSWDFTGERFVVTNANTGNVIGVYPFAAGVIGTLIDGLNPGGGEQATSPTFRPIENSPYVAFATATRVVVANVSAQPITLAAQVSTATSVGAFWTADGNYLIGVGTGVAGPNDIYIWAFDDTPGSESLTLIGTAADQTNGTPISVSVSPDRRYLAVARNTGSTEYPPEVWSISSAQPPVITKLASPASMGPSPLLLGLSWSGITNE